MIIFIANTVYLFCEITKIEKDCLRKVAFDIVLNIWFSPFVFVDIGQSVN